MPERVTRLEARTEVLPGLLADVDNLKAKADREKGRDDMLRLIAWLVFGSGLLSLIGDAIILSHR